jgi:hypothetical protein
MAAAVLTTGLPAGCSRAEHLFDQASAVPPWCMRPCFVVVSTFATAAGSTVLLEANDHDVGLLL